MNERAYGVISGVVHAPKKFSVYDTCGCVGFPTKYFCETSSEIGRSNIKWA